MFSWLTRKDDWVTLKLQEQGLKGLIIRIVISISIYAYFYWLPEITLFIGWEPFTPSTQSLLMVYINIFMVIMLLFVVSDVIYFLKRIRNKKKKMGSA